MTLTHITVNIIIAALSLLFFFVISNLQSLFNDTGNSPVLIMFSHSAIFSTLFYTLQLMCHIYSVRTRIGFLQGK